MRPAFSSTKEAAAFALLLLLLLAAPWLAHQTFLPRREQSYSSQSIRWEKFPWVQKFIFEETNDIDIAFVGSSHIGLGIDTPYVQQKLSEQLGHETVVRSIYFIYPGFDALYFFTKDLLAHRRVKTLVFYDECCGPIPYLVHQCAPAWFRYGDDGGVLSGLPFGYQVIYYYAAMIGMPRNLLELVTSNMPNTPNDKMTSPFTMWHTDNPETTLGCQSLRVGFDPSGRAGNTHFTPYVPQTGVTPEDVSIFSPAKATNFVFSDRPLPISQVYFAKQFSLLAKAHGCSLVALHIPSLDESSSPVMTETRDWSALMQTDLWLMGIAPNRFFAGLSELEVQKLSADPGHLNANGQRYFTSLITHELIQFYESHSHH